MISWNPWHGCKKYSEGCKNCYVYRMDIRYGKNPSEIKVTKQFNLPVIKNIKGEYKYPSGTVFFTCYTSDFFLPEMKEERIKAIDVMLYTPWAHRVLTAEAERYVPSLKYITRLRLEKSILR